MFGMSSRMKQQLHELRTQVFDLQKNVALLEQYASGQLKWTPELDMDTLIKYARYEYTEVRLLAVVVEGFSNGKFNTRLLSYPVDKLPADGLRVQVRVNPALSFRGRHEWEIVGYVKDRESFENIWGALRQAYAHS